MVTDSDKSEYQKKYESWIKEVGAALSQQNNPNVFSETVYKHPNGIAVGIIQLREASDRILISTKLNFPPELQQTIGNLQQDEQMNLVNALKYGLLQMGLQFALPVQANSLQAVVVERTTFGEGLTKQIFFDNLYRVIDGLVFIQMTIHDRLGTRMDKAGGTSVYG